MKKFNYKLLLIISAFILSACHFGLDRTVFRYGLVSEKPSINEIVGIWITDESTIEDIKTQGKYDASVSTKLIFLEDGNFQMINMPDWWRSNFGEPRGGFETTKGKWELSNFNSDFWTINLNLGFLRTSLGLKESNFNREPKFIIVNTIGDPDNDHIMVFVKEK